MFNSLISTRQRTLHRLVLCVISLTAFGMLGSLLASAETIVIDDLQSGFSKGGPWASDTASAGLHAMTQYQVSSSSVVTATACWKPPIANEGLYTVSVWYGGMINDVTEANYEIRSLGEIFPVKINQSIKEGQWVPLGVYYFKPDTDASLTLTNKSSSPYKKVSADAAKFVWSGSTYPTAYQSSWLFAWGAGFLSASQTASTMAQLREQNQNAAFFQIRKVADAYYKSNIEPRATNISSSYPDPLADILEKAHDTTGGKQRIEVHGWFVPFRVWTGSGTPPAGHILYKHPEWVTLDNTGTNPDEGVLDAGIPAVQDYITDVILEIVKNYDIDGIHYDYIRYFGDQYGYNPESIKRFQTLYHRGDIPEPTDTEFGQFRRDQITNLVRRVYAKVKEVRWNVKMSASTITWIPAPPNGDFTRTRAYYDVFQDWPAMMEEGTLDLNVPMNYMRDSNTSQYNGYRTWTTFTGQHNGGRHAIIGPGSYLNSMRDNVRQLLFARDCPGIVGTSLYREFYTSLEGPSYETQSWRIIKGDVYDKRREVPDAPWITNPTFGIVYGTVTDASGTLIDGADVQILNTSLTPQKTDGSGFYAFVKVNPGAYRAVATFNGLMGLADFTIQAGKVAVANIQVDTESMKVGPTEPLSSAGFQGGPFSPNNKSYKLVNTSASAFRWIADVTEPWIETSELENDLLPGQEKIVSVIINSEAGNLTPGLHVAEVHFRRADTGFIRKIEVRLTVNDAIDISPITDFSSEGYFAGPFLPAQTTYTVRNQGSVSLPWSVKSASTWLTINPLSGVISGGRTRTVTVSINEQANLFPVSNSPHDVTMTFKNESSGLTVDRVTHLKVDEALFLYPPMDFYSEGYYMGPFAPKDATRTLYNPGSISIPWILDVSPPWVSFGANSGILAPGQIQDITLTLNDFAIFMPPADAPYESTMSFKDQTTGELVQQRALLKVNDVLEVTPPRTFYSEGYYGGPFSPRDATCVIQNVGKFFVPWSVSSETPWISFDDPTFGELPPSETQYISLRINDQANTLPASAIPHEATLLFHDGATNYDVRQIAYLKVNPVLEVTPTADINCYGAFSGPFYAYPNTYLLKNLGIAEVPWSASADQPWLSFDPPSGVLLGGATKEVTVSVNSAANDLAISGTPYQATMSFTDDINGLAGQRFANLYVGEGMYVWATTGDLVATGPYTGPFTPNTVTYQVYNYGNLDLPWSVDTDQPWLSFTPSFGVVPARTIQTVTATLNDEAKLLFVNDVTYEASIMFSDYISGYYQQFYAYLKVNENMTLTPGLNFSSRGYFGGPFSPKDVTYTITNLSQTEMPWSADVDKSWLTLTPSGSILPGGASETIRVSFSEEANILSVTDVPHDATVTFMNGLTGFIEERFAFLKIDEALDLAPRTDISSRGYVGGPFSPPEMTYRVRNLGAIDMPWSVDAVDAWLSFSPSAGVLVGGASQNIRVTFSDAVNALSVSDIPHQATMSFMDELTSLSKLRMAYLKVDESLVLTPESNIYAEGFAGSQFQGGKYVLQNLSKSDLPWSAEASEPWLDFTPSSGVLGQEATQEVNVTFNAAAATLLEATTPYSATMTFRSELSGIEYYRTAALRIRDVASMPFSEKFEMPLHSYWTVSGTNQARSEVTPLYQPYQGTKHFIMDASGTLPILSRNELTLAIDLEGFQDVMLSFWVRGVSDEPHTLPNRHFVDHANFDGVAVSADGVNWYEALSLASLPPYNVLRTINLSQVISEIGISFNERFRIRFNHYDDQMFPNDGILLDNIYIVGSPQDILKVSPSENYFAVADRRSLFMPPYKIYDLVNQGTEDIHWEAVSDANPHWLILDPTEGIIPVSASAELIVSATDTIISPTGEPMSIPPGVYSALIDITGSTVGNASSPLTISRSATLRLALRDHCTEFFQDQDNDLAYQSLTFIPDERLHTYQRCVGPDRPAGFPVGTALASPLPLGDNTYFKLQLTGNHRVRLYGMPYRIIYANSNGNITFDQPDYSFQPSLLQHFQSPRVSALFADLDPSKVGAKTTWQELNDRLVITFDSVPEFGRDDVKVSVNSFQIEMFYNGKIRVTYLNVGTQGGLVGLSEGRGIPVDYQETNLSECVLCATGMVLQLK